MGSSDCLGQRLREEMSNLLMRLAFGRDEILVQRMTNRTNVDGYRLRIAEKIKELVLKQNHFLIYGGPSEKKNISGSFIASFPGITMITVDQMSRVNEGIDTYKDTRWGLENSTRMGIDEVNFLSVYKESFSELMVDASVSPYNPWILSRSSDWNGKQEIVAHY